MFWFLTCLKAKICLARIFKDFLINVDGVENNCFFFINPIPAGELENQDTLGGVLNTIPAGVLENQDTLGGGGEFETPPS